MCTLNSNYFTLDVLLDASLEDDVDNDVLLKNGVEAAEDEKDVHHELADVADVLALVPPSQLEGHDVDVNEVVEAENDEDVVSEDGKDVERLDVHHRSGLECLTSMATHTGVSPEPKMLWVTRMYWMKVVDKVVRDDLDAEFEDVQDAMHVGLRWVEDGDVAI